ncbi:MAG: hypothetical protein ABI651_08030, partial [Verrucomicrobiota bacterium]
PSRLPRFAWRYWVCFLGTMVFQAEVRGWLRLAFLMFSIELAQPAVSGLLGLSFEPGSGADDVVHALLLAGLMRLAPPKILENGRVSLSLIVPVNEAITLERSADLTRWQSLLTTTATTNRVEVLDPDPPGDAARFYRLRRGSF